MGERIDICICTKDRKDYLLVTLASLLGQTYLDWDLILLDASSEPVVNDECCGRLLQTMKKYGHKIRYETDNGVGIPHAYQQMMEMSDKKLLVRQEDDIWLEPESLERIYSVLDTYPQFGACGWMTPNYKEHLVRTPPEQLRNGFVKSHSELCPNRPFIYEPVDEQQIIVEEDKLWSVCVLHAGSLYRREAAEAVGGFCTHLSPVGHREESLFYTRMYMSGWDLAVRSTARLWHFESNLGGSRPEGAHAEGRQNMRRSDESKFQAELEALITAHPDRPLTFLD